MDNLQAFYEGVADFLSDTLETIDSKLDYEIQPQIGEYQYQEIQGRIRRKKNPKISGVLIARQSELIPIKDYGVFTFTALLSVTAPKQYVRKVYNDISALVNAYNAVAVDSDPAFMMTFATPTVSNLDQRAGSGSSADIKVYITFVVYGEAVTGNDVQIGVEYDDNGVTKIEPLLYLQNAFQNIKSYESDNVGNYEHTISVPTSQTLAITIKVAYRKTPVLMQIVKDIFDGNLEKTYTLRYSDGAAVPHDTTINNVTTVNSIPLTLSIGQCTLNNAPGLISSIDMVCYRARPVDEEQTNGGSSTTPVDNPVDPPPISDEPGIPA